MAGIKGLFYVAMALGCSLGFSACVGCSNELPVAPRQQTPAPSTPVYQQSGPSEAAQRPVSPGSKPTVIHMIEEGGVYKIPVRINGAEMDFIFDTGASLISISNLEASYLIKQEKISPDDVQGSAQFVDAQGNVSVGTVLNIREVRIGDRTVHNIKASIVDNNEAPLLLGQTFLRKFGKIAIDYQAGTITFY